MIGASKCGRRLANFKEIGFAGGSASDESPGPGHGGAEGLSQDADSVPQSSDGAVNDASAQLYLLALENSAAEEGEETASAAEQAGRWNWAQPPAAAHAAPPVEARAPPQAILQPRQNQFAPEAQLQEKHNESAGERRYDRPHHDELHQLGVHVPFELS